ncbi:MAG: hypothetical protein HS101_01310 [Planctomycetia bacterium]|jgi:hypothetical protein|nr:hypothetical protein [Planctomycetia bacterium]MCC7315651.1 hypothetical protein [Planctomycetota bacterium]OQZ06116.1 MAG: hypothetical protein B6D36_06690 [Planctomycetes bacterium UTPLA1]
MKRIFPLVLLFVLPLAAFASDAAACSVCQGNPDSHLVKGAQGGVIVMVITTYGVILCMAALVATWFVRHRRLTRASGLKSTTRPESLLDADHE